MTLVDFYRAVRPALCRVNFRQPRAAILRAIRAELDVELPGWRATRSTTGEPHETLVITLNLPSGRSVDLVLWQAPDKAPQ